MDRYGLAWSSSLIVQNTRVYIEFSAKGLTNMIQIKNVCLCSFQQQIQHQQQMGSSYDDDDNDVNGDQNNQEFKYMIKEENQNDFTQKTGTSC